MTTARPLDDGLMTGLEACRGLILQLVAEGRLPLDDPIGQHLPGVVPSGHQLTARQFLSHPGSSPAGHGGESPASHPGEQVANQPGGSAGGPPIIPSGGSPASHPGEQVASYPPGGPFADHADGPPASHPHGPLADHAGGPPSGHPGGRPDPVQPPEVASHRHVPEPPPVAAQAAPVAAQTERGWRPAPAGDPGGPPASPSNGSTASWPPANHASGVTVTHPVGVPANRPGPVQPPEAVVELDLNPRTQASGTGRWGGPSYRPAGAEPPGEQPTPVQPADAPVEQEPETVAEQPAPRRRRRRPRRTDGAPQRTRRRPLPRILSFALGTVVLVGAGSAYWLGGQSENTAAASAPTGPAATTEVTRETLSATESFDGTLGHGDALTASAAEQGTITRTAAQDAEVQRNTELYRLNEQPVMALIGTLPMYRDLRDGNVGADVKQLEDNLAALGYEGFTVDEEFTAETEAAVRSWQNDVGAEETGVVARSDVVFVPEGGRVDTIHADAGGRVNPGSPVLDITGSEQVVSLDVPIADRDLVPVDTAVTVELPGGEEAGATVTAANVAQAPPAEGGGEEEAAGADTAVAKVEATLDEPVDESLLGSPVDVVVKADERKDVLVVPVKALLARSGDGYGLEVVAGDGTTEVVPVETGLFANGKVEVSGEGIDEGTVVGVAGR